MSTLDLLTKRSAGKCELCSSANNLTVYDAKPFEGSAEKALLLCAICTEQINNPANFDPNHWRCLNETIWSEVSAAKVMAWRILKNLNQENWAQDLLEQLYLEEADLAWAQSGIELEAGLEEKGAVTKDSNGTILAQGDSVTLIKDLDVKGANFTAKRGTLVKNISLTSNPEQIEGRVNGTQIVLLTRFLKKAN
ncbi:MAG: PhnA domain-containing protein [Bdellovibrio sp.]|nr:PhnA domain-containing protein [Bdellovibrio sp.]